MSLLVGKEPGRDRFRRLLKKGIIALVLLGMGSALALTALRRWTYLAPPGDDGPMLRGHAQLQTVGDRIRLVLGRSFAWEHAGLDALYLEGDAGALGHAHGVLATQKVVSFSEKMEAAFERMRPPPGLAAAWRRWRWRWRLHGFAGSAPAARIVELAKLAQKVHSPLARADTPFERLFHHHLEYDALESRCEGKISQNVAFAVWGRKGDGRVIVGRGFTLLPGDEVLARGQVFHVKESGKLSFVSVGWPGLVGVVTGVNEAKLFVSLAAACTDDSLADGYPSLMLARRVLQEARSLKEAVALLRRVRPGTAQALMVVDGKSGKGAVVELTPRRLALRRGGSWVALTNHLVHQKFRGDAKNDWVRRYTSSGARFDRLQQLLSRSASRMDTVHAAAVLRDRLGSKGEELGLGHGRALDSLEASHGVVLDLTNMILWVAAGPHLLGRFVPLDLRVLFGEVVDAKIPIKEIPADPLLKSADWRRHQLVRGELRYARRLMTGGHLSRATEHARRAAEAAPAYPRARLVYGELLKAGGDSAAAKAVLKSFVELGPAARKDIERVERYLVGD